MREFWEKLKANIKCIITGCDESLCVRGPLTETTIQERGYAAQALLENEAYVYALDKIERELYSAWRNSKPLDTEGRESVWLQFRAVQEIERKLTGIMNEFHLEKEKQNG